MSSIPKPPVRHPALPRNALGLTRRDYEGAMSTLCAGCGHDSITAALVQVFFELDLPPHRAIKFSGIGCSSKTTAYFLRQSHGFNAVHGRMPAVATGAAAANRELLAIGISGDGDSLSIGLGHFCHAIRRNVNLLYVLENNGVYGLTKGQHSPTHGRGMDIKEFSEESPPPFSPLRLALTAGATFVAQSFSGDPKHAAEIYVQALQHKGFAMVNDFSPCVTYNKFNTYDWYREHVEEIPAGHDPADINRAWDLLNDFDQRGRLPLGIVYRHPRNKKTFKRAPLWPQELADVDVKPLLREFV